VQFVGLAHEAITDGGGEPVKPPGVVELIGGGAARTVGRHVAAGRRLRRRLRRPLTAPVDDRSATGPP
jgi:hypothetical protein